MTWPPRPRPDGLRCKHCGCQITDGRYPVHVEGSHTGKGRCGSESNLPYGYTAAPEGTPCEMPCLGAP